MRIPKIGHDASRMVQIARNSTGLFATFAGKVYVFEKALTAASAFLDTEIQVVYDGRGRRGRFYLIRRGPTHAGNSIAALAGLQRAGRLAALADHRQDGRALSRGPGRRGAA